MKKIIVLLVMITTLITMTPLVSACGTLESKESTDSEYSKMDDTRYDFNEYDYIVKIREASKQEIMLMDLPEEEVNYITSDAIERELINRASLSVEELRAQYCYSDEAIEILKAYDGRPLEDAPEMRAVTASFYGALGEAVCTGTRIGVTYVWEWSTEPLWTYNDGVTVSWVGTYENGGNNNMYFDISTSYANINYYWAGNPKGKTEMVKGIDYFRSDAYTNGISLKFPCVKTFDGMDYWAKSGAAFIYIDLVNPENGPMLYSLSICGKYVHAISAVQWSASFPLGISVSFSGDVEVLGEKHLLLKP